MKSLIRISLSVILACTLFTVSAQSDPTPNTGWVVSKDVQRYSNKSLSEPTGVQVRSVGTPEHVNSKMTKRSSQTDATSRNVKSAGTPAWVVSKPVQVNKK